MATRNEQIEWAASLLRAGILASNLPGRLMDEYNLTPDKAREIAGAAIRKHKQAKKPVK